MIEKKPLNPEDLKQAQKIMLYITKKVHAICVKHNIKYWLDWGSLLGCVRHGGFIPWDDDMDICMQRDEYEKFLAVASEELGDEFFVQHSGTDPQFDYPYCKVRLNGTRWVSHSWKEVDLKSQGIWIDIFPMDSFPASPFNAKVASFLMFLFRSAYHWHADIRSPHPVKRRIQHLLAIMLSKNNALKLQNRLFEALKRYKNSGVLAMYCMNTPRSICKQAVFEKLELRKFEDTEFFIPENYDERLKGLYGDYMKLPPPEARVNYHHIIELDFGKYRSL